MMDKFVFPGAEKLTLTTKRASVIRKVIVVVIIENAFCRDSAQSE
jgi:hypothetical protein